METVNWFLSSLSGFILVNVYRGEFLPFPVETVDNAWYFSITRLHAVFCGLRAARSHSLAAV